MIEAQLAMPVTEIFRQFGEPTFRQLEAECLHSLAVKKQLVVATGGGVPCFYGNMQWMNENGITIYFYAPTQLLVQRLSPEKAHRPLLAGLSDADFDAFIEEKLAERAPFYELCHLQFTVPAEGFQGIEALANYLSRFFT
jgi:shikimate kinase